MLSCGKKGVSISLVLDRYRVVRDGRTDRQNYDT